MSTVEEPRVWATDVYSHESEGLAVFYRLRGYRSSGAQPQIPTLFVHFNVVWLVLVLFVCPLPLFAAVDANPHAFRVTGPPPAAWPNSTRTGLKFAAHQ